MSNEAKREYCSVPYKTWITKASMQSIEKTTENAVRKW